MIKLVGAGLAGLVASKKIQNFLENTDSQSSARAIAVAGYKKMGVVRWVRNQKKKQNK